MKIAIAQLDAGVLPIEERRAAMMAAVREAARQDCRITVLPELAVTGYGAGHAIAAEAEDMNGRDTAWLKSLAAETGCAVVAGLALKREGDLFNAALFAAPDGTSVTYDKIHLYGDYEKSMFSRGDTPPPVIEFEGLSFGLLVCFDVEFPERVRDLALRGADAVLVPTALPKSDGGAFTACNVVPVRAFENQIFVAYANHAGQDRRFTYQGQSCVAAPDGRLLAQARPDASDLILADINPDGYDACRAQNPYLAEIRDVPGVVKL